MNFNLISEEESDKVIQSVINKAINRVWLDQETDCLHFRFFDGIEIIISDQNLSGESRTMTTDDDLTQFARSVFLGIELKDVPSIDTEFGLHEMQFLDVITDKGKFQMVNHNDHDGTYSGFRIVAQAI